MSASGQPLTAAPRRVTFRAVALGLACSAGLCAVTPYNDFKVAATYISGNQFPIGAIFVVMLLSGAINPLLRKIGQAERAWSQSEMLSVWAIILVAAGLPSSGMMRFFIPQIVAVHYFSNDLNHWQNSVWGTQPGYLQIGDKAAVDAFYRGYPHGQEHIPWEAWWLPLFSWSLLAALFLGASFCVAALLRRQWVENERFAFPLVTLPVLLTEPPENGALVSPLWRQPLLWAGVGLVTVLHTGKGLHQLYPVIPEVPTHVNLMDYLTAAPYNQLAPFEIWVYPLVIGLAYLLSREVCFSLWFFYLFFKAQIVLGTRYNWDMPGALSASSQKQFHSLEAFGGGIALLLWTLWTGRHHFRTVWEKAVRGPGAGQIDDSGEMLSYRAGLVGLALTYGGIAAWLYAAGVEPPYIGMTLLILTMVFTVVSWMICQAGMLFLPTPYSSIDVLAGSLGSARLDIPSLYATARFENTFLSGTREMVTPSVLNSLKTADAAGFSPRALLLPLALSVGIGFVVSAWAALALPYYNGGANSLSDPWGYVMSPQRPLKFLGGAVSVPYVAAPTNFLHIGGGLLGVLGLLVVRARFGIGLHPLGFLAASGYAAQVLWFSQLIGWLATTLIQRYGGRKAYMTLLPFFMGLIVGDVLNAVVWIILGYATGTGYRLMPA